jgi:hypothetical protein
MAVVSIAIETLHKKVQSFSIAERDSNYVFTSLMTPTPMAAPAVKDMAKTTSKC